MDAIVILGAAVWPDGPSPTLRRRTAHAASLWHANRAPQIVACGGLGAYPPTEAAAMRALLLADGVTDSHIMLEDQSTTTLENIRNAARLLPGPQIILVTDAYHARRARLVAAHFGLHATVESPAVTRSQFKHRFRETFALPAYALKLRRIPRNLNSS